MSGFLFWSDSVPPGFRRCKTQTWVAHAKEWYLIFRKLHFTSSLSFYSHFKCHFTCLWEIFSPPLGRFPLLSVFFFLFMHFSIVTGLFVFHISSLLKVLKCALIHRINHWKIPLSLCVYIFWRFKGASNVYSAFKLCTILSWALFLYKV